MSEESDDTVRCPYVEGEGLLIDTPIFKRHIHNGVQLLYRFPNDYGASVIKSDLSYGNKQGLWEVAVLRYFGPDTWDWKISYDTPLTNDVVGWLVPVEIEALLIAISKL